MVVIPIVQLFGLLYKDLLLENLKMTSVEINTIVATNCSFGMLLGEKYPVLVVVFLFVVLIASPLVKLQIEK